MNAKIFFILVFFILRTSAFCQNKLDTSSLNELGYDTFYSSIKKRLTYQKRLKIFKVLYSDVFLQSPVTTHYFVSQDSSGQYANASVAMFDNKYSYSKSGDTLKHFYVFFDCTAKKLICNLIWKDICIRHYTLEKVSKRAFSDYGEFGLAYWNSYKNFQRTHSQLKYIWVQRQDVNSHKIKKNKQ